MRSALATLIIFIILCSSCSHSTEKLILGKWKFDHVDTKDHSGGSSLEDQMQEMINALSGMDYTYLTMTFYSNGECMIVKDMSSNVNRGPYRIADHGKTLVTTDEYGTEEQMEIVRIDQNELVIVRSGTTLVLVRE